MTNKNIIHVNSEFANIVEQHIPKLDILNYYPYGPKTDWTYWLCGDVDLRKVYKDERNAPRTSEQLVFKIIQEVGYAMNYLMIHGNNDWFNRQRIEAFAMWRLFNMGIVNWTKKPLKGLSNSEKDKLYEIHEKRANKMYGHPAFGYSYDMKFKTKKQKEEMKDLDLKHKMYNRKKYGIYYIEHLPLLQYTNNGKNHIKPLYTKQELAAIWLMVNCAFENLC